MAPRTSANLINGVERILDDVSSNAIFLATDISAELQVDLAELSGYSPWEIIQTKIMESSYRLGTRLTGNVGREIDIFDIENLIDLKVEYPVGDSPPTFREFKRYGGKIYIDISARPVPGAQNDSAGNAQVLTGTVTFASGSTAVTGSGTAFLSELEVGYYIATGSIWYRVASIADDTTLIISENCDAADTGADSATRYWYEYVNLWCKKNHYVETLMTDFVGAIDSGGATGYARGTHKIHIDALGSTDTIPKDMLLTIAGTLGVYRVTADSLLSSSEGDLYIEPRLKERAAEDAIVTLLGSTLSQDEERVLMELAAVRSALNWVGGARTTLENAKTAYGLANTEVDKISARILLITTASTGYIAKMSSAVTANFSKVTSQIGDAEDELDSAASACAAIDSVIGDYTTTSGKAVTGIEDALASLDLAIGNIGDIETGITATDAGVATEIGLIKTQLGTAVTDLETDVDAVNNTIPIGANVPGNIINKAMGLIATARGYADSADALKEPLSHHGAQATRQTQLAIAQLREAQTFITLEGAVTQENALAVRSYVQTAQGYIREANAYIQADAQQIASYARTISSELAVVNGFLGQAGGYFQEANTSIRTSYAITAVNKWARDKLRDVKQELKKMQKPNQKQFGLPRAK